MDGLSVVAGVATAGVQLSRSLYDLYSTVKISRREIQDVANNVSLLAMVLEELDGVLCDDELNYRPQLRDAAQSIALRCATIFKDIRKHTGTDLSLRGQRFHEKLAWYFRRDRVKFLRCSLESLKSTLSILLHVVQLAKSTKGVEEYPGVKPIGHWYVRKERRGLVCLVVDNRQAVERLKQLEDAKAQEDLNRTDKEPPLTLADIFPPSTSNRKRSKSPERKFVVLFRNHGRRTDDDSRRLQDLDTDSLPANPSTPSADIFLLPSPRRENQSHWDPSTDSDGTSIGQSMPSESTRKSRAKTRPTEEQATSRLILDVIPHGEADKAFISAQNMSGSALLEAKTEDTIDTLLHRWTFVDPSYFTADDRSSISSTETSLPSRQNKTDQHSHGRKSLDAAENLSSPHETSGRRRADFLESHGLRKELDHSQCKPVQRDLESSSPLAAGRKRGIKKRPDPLHTTIENAQGIPEAVTERSLSHTQDNKELPNPKEPSTPAPPYISCDSEQNPSCHGASASAPSSSKVRHPSQPSEVQIGDTKTDYATNSTIESAIRLMETKFLEIMKQSSLQNDFNDTQSRHRTEQLGDRSRAMTMEQQADPVIMKDVLGRKYLFPFQKCREWQSMENLIKRCFSHVGSMSPKILEGSYDILSPTGEIILPEVWDSVIQPGWVVELRIWKCAEAVEEVQKDSDVGGTEMAPSVQFTSTPTGKSHVHVSGEIESGTVKPRASLKTWLGSRRSTPSVLLG